MASGFSVDSAFKDGDGEVCLSDSERRERKAKVSESVVELVGKHLPVRGRDNSPPPSTTTPPPVTDDLTAMQAFHEVFWPAYPRKICKSDALKAWKSLKLKDSDQEALDAIMAGLARFVADEWRLDEPQYIPYPATWLRGRRWE